MLETRPRFAVTLTAVLTFAAALTAVAQAQAKAAARAAAPRATAAPAATSYRAPASISEETNLREGNIAVSVDSTLSITLPNKGDNTTQLYLGAEYFLKDAFSLGGAFGVNSTNVANTFTLGPSASYYFWNQGKLAAGAHTGLLLANSSPKSGGSNTTYFNFNLGASGHYFIIPAISVGPEAALRFFFGNEQLSRNFEFALLGRFNIYF